MALALDTSYTEGLERERHRLAGAGVWWTGPERVAIAAQARAARNNSTAPDGGLPEAAVEAAIRLSADPHVDLAWVEELERRGLDRPAYVEILGVVSRLNAIDTFCFGIGHDFRPLPEPHIDGVPTRAVVADAEMNGAFVPTVGVPFPPTALSAVPPENEALVDLHGVLYLSMFEMGDHEIVKDLTRVQIELIAARTSLLNDCFY